jgi:hypothetical protein
VLDGNGSDRQLESPSTIARQPPTSSYFPPRFSQTSIPPSLEPCELWSADRPHAVRQPCSAARFPLAPSSSSSFSCPSSISRLLPVSGLSAACRMANTLAASSTLCKCACFGKSMLIGLDGKPESSPASPVGKSDTKQGHGTCLDCNKQFCQNYNLPICRDAKDEDVIATCYRMTPPLWSTDRLISG